MKDINILVFGDSIVYGAYDDEKAGWVNRLRIMLESKNDTYYNIFNLGIAGNTTIDVLKRLKYECENRCVPDAKNIIIFAVGINDSQIINQKNNVQKEAFKLNLINIITLAKKYADEIMFLGLTRVDESKTVPIPWNPSICYFNKRIIEFDNELENICMEKNVGYLKMYDLLEKEELTDGLHPDSNGHQKIAEKVINKLKIK